MLIRGQNDGDYILCMWNIGRYHFGTLLGELMITTQEIEKALHFLVNSASEAGQNRANRIYLEEYRKSLKAQIMSQYQELPVNAQEREAYKNVEYIEHLDAMKSAIQEDEKMRFLIEAAKVKISVWQTMEKMKVNV